MPRVYNCRRGAVPQPPPDAVYVGRGSPWGNPIRLEEESQREEVLRDYEAFLSRQPELVARIKRELRGKDLVCWCAPKTCHADLLLRIANEDYVPRAATWWDVDLVEEERRQVERDSEDAADDQAGGD